MKKRARKIQVWLACVFAVILLWNLGQVEAKVSTAQEDNRYHLWCQCTRRGRNGEQWIADFK